MGRAVHSARGLTWGAVASACAGVYAAAYAAQGRYREAAIEGVSALTGGVAGRVVRTVGARAKTPWKAAVAKRQPVMRSHLRNYDRTIKRGSNLVGVIVTMRTGEEARRKWVR